MTTFYSTPSQLTAKLGLAATNITIGNDEHVPVTLTVREVEVLNHSFHGKTSKEVADTLFVSKRTVDFHLANAYAKLSVSNRVQAYRRATALGFVPSDI